MLGKIHKHTYYTANIHILRLCLFINDHQINVNIVCTTHITHHRNPPHNVNWVTWGSKTMKMKRFLRCVCVCVLRSVLPPKYKISVQWNYMLTWDTLMLPIWVFFFVCCCGCCSGFTYVSMWEAIDADYSIQCIFWCRYIKTKSDEHNKTQTPSIWRIVYTFCIDLLGFEVVVDDDDDAAVVVVVDAVVVTIGRDHYIQIWIYKTDVVARDYNQSLFP